MRTPDRTIKLTSKQSKALRDKRLSRGFTVRELADRARVSHNTINQLENHKRGTSLLTLKNIARALGMKVNFKVVLEIK